MSAEGQHREGDQGFWLPEPEGDPSQDADLGVGGLHEGVGHVVVQGRVERLTMFGDLAGEVDERGDLAASGPAQPPVEGVPPSPSLSR